MTYGSGGKEERECQREEIASQVALQSGGWAKASFPFHVMLCHYEASSCFVMCAYIILIRDVPQEKFTKRYSEIQCIR